MSVCLASWNRPVTFARSFTFCHALLIDVIGFVGSKGRLFPVVGFPILPGKMCQFAFVVPNLDVYHFACSIKAENRVSFSGMVRPSPAAVLLFATVSTRCSKSICPQVRFRISEFRIPALNARASAGAIKGDLVAPFLVCSAASGAVSVAFGWSAWSTTRAALRSASFWSRVYALPTSLLTRSFSRLPKNPL